jgi:hypothetical protein
MKTWASLLTAFALVGCARSDGPTGVAATASARAPASSPSVATVAESDAAALAKHLEWWPGLSVRKGNALVDASPADVAVAKSYARFADKGALSPTGERLTILTAKRTYAASEEVRVLHVYEATLVGTEVYVMGPKEIFGERIDGKPVTKPRLVATSYDGAVMKSPWADYNYDVTAYRLAPGTHTIQWVSETVAPHSPMLSSNVLTIEVK